MQQIEELRDSVDRLSTEAIQVRRELHQRTRIFIMVVGAGAIVLAAVVAAAFVVSLDNRRAIEENNRRWCPVVAPLAPRAGDPPPVGTPEQRERSQRIRVAFGQLVKDFGCV
jgi:hypothetical protein